MTTENREAILRRVQKLLAIAEHERSDPNEAAAAAGMAERIMRKHQLEYAEVIAADLRKGEDLSRADYVASAKTNGTKVKVVPTWAGMIAVAVAKFNDCGARTGRADSGDACVSLFGFSGDVLVAKWMLDYLVLTVNRLCDEYKKTPEYEFGGRAVVNSYRQGVAIGIVQALTVLTNQKQAEQRATVEASLTGTSLMVVKQDAITAKYGDFGYKSTKTKVSRGDAFTQGKADGKAVDVSRRAVGSTGSSKLLN